MKRATRRHHEWPPVDITNPLTLEWSQTHGRPSYPQYSPTRTILSPSRSLPTPMALRLDPRTPHQPWHWRPRTPFPLLARLSGRLASRATQRRSQRIARLPRKDYRELDHGCYAIEGNKPLPAFSGQDRGLSAPPGSPSYFWQKITSGSPSSEEPAPQGDTEGQKTRNYFAMGIHALA